MQLARVVTVATRGLQPSLPGPMLWCLPKLGLCLVSCTPCSPYEAACHQSPSPWAWAFPQSPETSQVISGQAANEVVPNHSTCLPPWFIMLLCSSHQTTLYSSLPKPNLHLWLPLAQGPFHLSPEALSPHPSEASSVLLVIRSLYALRRV